MAPGSEGQQPDAAQGRQRPSEELERRLGESAAEVRAAEALRQAADSMAEPAPPDAPSCAAAAGGGAGGPGSEALAGAAGAQQAAAAPPELVSVPRAELEELRLRAAELQECRERLLRARADLDNLQKRLRREIAEAEVGVTRSLLAGVLPVLDNLELSLAAARQSQDIEAVIRGVELIRDEFRRFLRELGVVRIETVGKPFDPRWHEALGAVEREGVEPNTVVAELRPGYRLGDRVLRAAQVQVASAPPAERD
ncbi:MAG: hypothetical protein KatS3mg102_0008 [Planctomycetota bacterium]|nr:MAG: hypothetical protein KatS3mg102_0008 [Planctomycetota bacterium]